MASNVPDGYRTIYIEVSKMERAKLKISIAVGLAAVLIIWRVGFYPPVPEPTEKPSETTVAVEPDKPGDIEEPIEEPGDANEVMVSFDVNEPQSPTDVNEPEILVADAEPSELSEPNEPMESVNLQSVQMRTIIQRLAEWTGKTIIPADEAQQQRVTIYAPRRLPRSEALAMIYAALHMKGYIAEHSDKVIFLKPLAQAKLGEVPTIAADFPLATIENKDQVVQKFFRLQNYSPSQMGQIVLPLVGEYGYVSADDSTSTLLVIDTVKNLMRIGLIIEQYDVVVTEEMITEIFEVRNGNPEEIVALLQKLLESETSRGIGRGGFFQRFGPGGGGPPGGDRGRPSGESSRPSSERTSRSGTTSGTATAVSVSTSRTPPVLIPETTYNWIIAKATAEQMEWIAEWIEKLDKPVATMLADFPLSDVEDKNKIVQKFFKLQNYSPMQMSQIIGPLLGASGYVSADESTRTLMVIDTVENLMRLETIMEQFDVPEAEQTTTNIFEIRYGDPSEIVQMLRILFEGEGYGSRSRSSSRSSYGSSGRDYGRSSSGYGGPMTFGGMSGRFGMMTSGRSSSSGTTVTVGTAGGPIILIPEPRRKWIIARASAEDMSQITEWIKKLDMQEPVESEYEVVQLRYADPEEVQDSIEEGFEDMPGTEFLPSVLVRPLYETRQVMVFGRQELREMVKQMIAEIDIPPGQFETVHFKLKYADPDEMKEKLDELFQEQTSGSSSRYGSYFGGYSSYNRGRSRSSSTMMPPGTVRVISYVALREITVVASPENMEEIKKRIAQWDVPLDVEALKPRIIELRNTDPVEMASLLTTLFSDSGSSTGGRGSSSIYRAMLGGTSETQQRIVGPLYGQLTFEEVPSTKKIIVISNIAEAYEVVENLIRELDGEEMAEIPHVITLKYANPERLCEILNAMFSEPGTSASIQRSDVGLAEYSMEESNTASQGTTTTQAGQFTPWWSGAGARSSVSNEMPISNVIGRIRFVPEPRTKAVLVLAPPQFMTNITTLIEELDIPGKQVMIKAVIVEVDHKDLTSLGLQVATNADAFGTLEENAITALNALRQLDTHGAAVFGASGAQGTVVTNTVTSNVNVLLDFLVKKVNAKILNQQTLWTEDNEEASFFKGSNVAFQTSMTTSATAGNVQNFEFQRVGMNLAVRPSITPNNNVDMIINIIISQLTSDRENNQPVRTEMETQTNMIVGDSETIMLGGILFQQDSLVERKIPLLGDVPVVGGLFRHKETEVANNEMLVFITPYVVDIDDPNAMLPATIEQIERPKEKLEDIQQKLDAAMEILED